MKIEFFGGEGRQYADVNYLISSDHVDGEPSIYAEVSIPYGASDEYGYLTMKQAIISKISKETAQSLEWFYDDSEDLPDDADAACDVFVDIDCGDDCFQGFVYASPSAKD